MMNASIPTTTTEPKPMAIFTPTLRLVFEESEPDMKGEGVAVPGPGVLVFVSATVLGAAGECARVFVSTGVVEISSGATKSH